MGRNPLLIIVGLFLLLFILLPLLSRKSSSSLNDNDRALRTNQALVRIENAESSYLKTNGRYTGHLADLAPIAPAIVTDLSDGVVSISVDSNNNKAYLVQVASTVLSFTRAYQDGKIVKKTCLQLKSAGDKYCKRKTSDVKKSVPQGTAPVGPTGQ